MSRDNVITVLPIEQDRLYNGAGSLSTDIHPSSSMHDHTYCTSLSEDVIPSYLYRVLRRYSDGMYYGPDAPFIPHNSDIPTMTGIKGLEQKRCMDISRLNIQKSCSDAQCINYSNTRTSNSDQRQLDTPQYQDGSNAHNNKQRQPEYSPFEKSNKFTVTTNGLIRTVWPKCQQCTDFPRPNSVRTQREPRLYNIDHLKTASPSSPFGDKDTQVTTPNQRSADTESPTCRSDNSFSPSNKTINDPEMESVNINIESNNTYPWKPRGVVAERLMKDCKDTMSVCSQFEAEEKTNDGSIVTVNLGSQQEQASAKVDSITDINRPVTKDENQTSNFVTEVSLSSRDCGGKYKADSVTEINRHSKVTPPWYKADYMEDRQRPLNARPSNVSDTTMSSITCRPCYATFNTRLEMARHLILRHPVTNLYNCCKCGQIFLSKELLNKHDDACRMQRTETYNENDHHKRLKADYNSVTSDRGMTGTEAMHCKFGISMELYKCQCCERVFSSPDDLYRHHINVTVEKSAIPIYICHYCRKPVRYTHRCSACKRVFCTYNHLNVHTSQKHYYKLLGYRPGNEIGKCQVCGMLLRINGMTRTHPLCRTTFCVWCYKGHTKYTGQKYICAKCKVEFINVCAVNLHVLVCGPVVQDITLPTILFADSISEQQAQTSDIHVEATEPREMILNRDTENVTQERDIYMNRHWQDGPQGQEFRSGTGNTENTNDELSVIGATEYTDDGVSVIGATNHCTNIGLSGIGYEEHVPTEYDGEASVPLEEKPYVYVEIVKENNETVSQISARQEVSVASMTSPNSQKPTKLYMCHHCGDIFTVESDLRKHVTLGVCESRIVPKMETSEPCFVETYMSDNHVNVTEHVNMETQSVDDYGSEPVIIKPEPANTDDTGYTNIGH